MEIETIDGGLVNTDKLPDLRSQMIELVDKSGIRDFAMKHEGMCYVLTATKDGGAWSTFHLPDKRSFDFVINCVDEMFRKITNNKFKLVVVPNEENNNVKD